MKDRKQPERERIKSDSQIRNAKAEERPYRRPVESGLYLEVRPTGARLWRYRYRLPDANGVKRENLFALGAYGKKGADAGEFTLEEARQERARLRELVKQGIHPAAARKQARTAVIEAQANTFKAVSLAWIEENRKRWTPYYLKQIERGLREDVYPAIGNRAIASIVAPDLHKIIKAKKATAPTVALLLRQWMGAVFRYAVAEHLATGDPTSALRQSVKRAPVTNKTPLRDRDIPGFMEALDKSEAEGVRPTSIALRILLYTFVRPGELRGAKWRELDLDGAIWRIPAERMKNRQPHNVPLSSQAVALFRDLHKITGGQEWLFPNVRDPKRPMSATTLNRVLERMKYGGRLSAHGFRATASTWLNEAGYRPDVIERQLSHKERNAVRASYNKAEYLPERRAMMQQWADAVDAMGAGKVIPIGSARAA